MKNRAQSKIKHYKYSLLPFLCEEIQKVIKLALLSKNLEPKCLEYQLSRGKESRDMDPTQKPLLQGSDSIKVHSQSTLV
jgi:hypothetical protein